MDRSKRRQEAALRNQKKYIWEPFYPVYEKIVYIYGPDLYRRAKDEIDAVLQSAHAGKATFLCADWVVYTSGDTTPTQLNVDATQSAMAKIFFKQNHAVSIVPIDNIRPQALSSPVKGMIIFGNVISNTTSSETHWELPSEITSDASLRAYLAGVPVTGGAVQHADKCHGPSGYYLFGQNIYLHNLIITSKDQALRDIMPFRESCYKSTPYNCQRMGLIFGAVAPPDSKKACYLNWEIIWSLREAFPTTRFAGFGTEFVHAGSFPNLRQSHATVISIISIAN